MWTSVINSKVSIHISIQMNTMCGIYIHGFFITNKMWNYENMRREHIVKYWTKSWEPRIILMLITIFVIIWKKLITFHLIKYNLIYKNEATFWSEFHVNIIWDMNKFESIISDISIAVMQKSCFKICKIIMLSLCNCFLFRCVIFVMIINLYMRNILNLLWKISGYWLHSHSSIDPTIKLFPT